MMSCPGRTLAGVDGCRAGWVAVIAAPGEELFSAVFQRFEELVESLPADAIIAVDMPIGLPDFSVQGGRGPEALVRKLLGPRQSSVFAIPSRQAVYATDALYSTRDRWYEDHRTASGAARITSDPPRGVSIQAFGIFARIQELDLLLRSSPGLCDRVVESHPEVAFWALNGRRAMQWPKKVKGSINPAGMDERRILLGLSGITPAFLGNRPPRGAGDDDFLDACAMVLVASRVASGEAMCFPDPPLHDAHGLPIAIRC